MMFIECAVFILRINSVRLASIVSEGDLANLPGVLSKEPTKRRPSILPWNGRPVDRCCGKTNLSYGNSAKIESKEEKTDESDL